MKKNTLGVAVVITQGCVDSRRSDGSWAAFVAENGDVNEATRKALKAKAVYEQTGRGPYEVYAGVLNVAAKEKLNFTLKPIPKG